MKTVKAWHFVGNTLLDGSPIPADGIWLKYTKPIVICNSGLHASREPRDALSYAPGNTLCYVECSGIITEHGDKFVCNSRKIISRIDFTEKLFKFSREQALSVIHLWKAPKIVQDYLKSGDPKLRLAAYATASAANAAAYATASDAAYAAAYAANATYAAYATAYAAHATYAAIYAAIYAAYAAHAAANSAYEIQRAVGGTAHDKALKEAANVARKSFNSFVYKEFNIVQN